MKTASVRDLRNHFARLSKWLENGEPIQLLKRGKPFARVIPEPNSSSFLGRMAGTASVPKDNDEPVAIKWDAAM